MGEAIIATIIGNIITLYFGVIIFKKLLLFKKKIDNSKEITTLYAEGIPHVTLKYALQACVKEILKILKNLLRNYIYYLTIEDLLLIFDKNPYKRRSGLLVSDFCDLFYFLGRFFGLLKVIVVGFPPLSKSKKFLLRASKNKYVYYIRKKE